MLFGNKLKLISACLLGALSFASHAESFKSLVTSAIKDGRSQGELDSETLKRFSRLTKSNSNVQISMERLVEYSTECALILVTSKQDHVAFNGKQSPLDLSFKLPICTDGSYPKTLQMEDEERKKKSLTLCQQSISKEGIKDGFERGRMHFANCPVNGVVGLFYDGGCNVLEPGPNAIVKEFKINGDGALDIQMMIPQQCLKPNTPNKWQLYIFERRGATYPKEVIGNRSIAW